MRAAALCALLLVACGRKSPPIADEIDSKSSVIAPTTDPSHDAAAPGESLYQLHPSLVDQEGRVIGLDAFRGHPVLISMFYAQCKSACPLLVSSVRQLESQLSGSERTDLRVLLVSFDGVHDTPSVLAKLASDHHVDASRWRFASTKDDDARTLAAVLGIQYRPLGGGEFAHNSVLTLLDRTGNVVDTTEALQAPCDDFTAHVRATLAATPARP
ncbi:MAG: SCO family protein [Polyangiaceae bacterium]